MAANFCMICGQPKELCICGEIAKETEKIKIRVNYRRFGKTVTTVSGLDDLKRLQELEKILKRKLACGGTLKEKVIELQGDHKEKAKEILLKEGYKDELIDID